MKKQLLFTTLLVFLGVFSCSGLVQAGFGISPPYVKTAKPIFPGSHYEQKVTLLRSSAEEILSAEIRINAPEIKDWISIDRGTLFDLPKGEVQVPMVVIVDVPSDAEVGEYRGHINIRIVPKEGSQESGVAIALGARVDIDLSITDETFIDFFVRKVEAPSIEMLSKPWNWKMFSWLFYKVKVVMTIENTGNVEVAPTRVHVDIYDIGDKKLLESHDDKRIEKIPPFEIKDVVASFPTKLGVGQYWASISIYDEKEIVQRNKISFDIKPAGTLNTELGKGPWLVVGGLVITAILLLLLLIRFRFWVYLFKILFIISWPFRIITKYITRLFGIIKKSFWKWMHKKSSEFQDDKDKKIE